MAEKSIKIDSIGMGKQLKLTGSIALPNGFKLNAQAPSKIAVFEKDKTQWVLTENVNLNDFFSLSEIIQFNRPIQLKSDVSELKIEASLYQCPRLGKGICVIDDYEGLIKRDLQKKNTEVKLALKGRSPT